MLAVSDEPSFDAEPPTYTPAPVWLAALSLEKPEPFTVDAAMLPPLMFTLPRPDAEYVVVCAGASAVKWKAIQDPQADLAAIERLLSPLREVEAERFVLVSTVDVYERPVCVDEDSPADATPRRASRCCGALTH